MVLRYDDPPDSSCAAESTTPNDDAQARAFRRNELPQFREVLDPFDYLIRRIDFSGISQSIALGGATLNWRYCQPPASRTSWNAAAYSYLRPSQ